MRNESAISVRFKVDIILIVIIVIVAGLVIIAHHPYHSTTEDARAHAMMPPQMGHGETLLLLPSTSEPANTFPELDFSFAWYNVLTQEIGPFSIALAKDINESTFEGMRLIIVPRRTAQSMTDAQINYVEAAVTRGATLIVEMPTPTWANLTAVKKKPQSNTAIKHFTDAPNTPLPSNLRDPLLDFPLDAQIMRIDNLENEALGSADLLLELDGAIAHYHRAFGAGHVFVLAFDMGQALTTMQQGRPEDDFKITVPEEAAFATPASLISNDRLKSNLTPYADILKRHILLSVWRYAPQASLWPFPNAERSALILTHDAAYVGDDANYIIEAEQKNNVVSTLFASPENTTGTWLSSIPSQGHEVGSLFIRPPAGQSWRKIGPSFFSPVHVERNMSDQHALISNRAKAPANTCRKYARQWSSDYTTAFRELVAAKCQVDLTYTPDDAQQGYIFGSGFPFLPMDKGGLPFPIYEFPTLLSDGNKTPIDPQTALKLIRESNDIYHEPIIMNFSADTMREHPHYQAVDAWLQAIELAQKTHTRITTVQNFMQHFSIRKKAQIQSNFNESTKTLDVVLDLPDSPDAYTVALPSRTQYGYIQSITIDKQPCDNKFSATGGLQTLVAVPPGTHRITVAY